MVLTPIVVKSMSTPPQFVEHDLELRGFVDVEWIAHSSSTR